MCVYVCVCVCVCVHVCVHVCICALMCFNQRGEISTLKGGPLKLVDKFTYLGSSVSSNGNDISKRLSNEWTTIEGYRSYGSQT